MAMGVDRVSRSHRENRSMLTEASVLDYRRAEAEQLGLGRLEGYGGAVLVGVLRHLPKSVVFTYSKSGFALSVFRRIYFVFSLTCTSFAWFLDRR